VIKAPLVALKETADVVCTVPSLKAIPLEPNLTPVIEAMSPVVKTELSAGYVTKIVAAPDRCIGLPAPLELAMTVSLEITFEL